MTSPLRRVLALALTGMVGLGTAVAGTTATLAAAAPTGPQAVGAHQAAEARPLTVRVRFGADGLGVAVGRIAPGGTVFQVSGNMQGGAVVLARLMPGYTAEEVARDFRRGGRGSVAALRRMNRRAVFLGGVEVRMDAWTRFAADVPAGRYQLVDLRSGETARLRVVGEPEPRPLPTVAATADFVVPAEEGGRGIAVAETIPTSGWVQHTNTTDEAQLMLIDPVAAGTTEESVAEHFDSHEAKGDIAFRPGLAPSMLVSPGHTYSWEYEVPAGRVLLWSYFPGKADGEKLAWHGVWALSEAVPAPAG